MASREMHSFATASKTLILIGVLLSTLEVTITLSHPLSYNTYDAKELSSDHPQLLLLVDHRMPELENEMFDTNNDPGSTVIRTKRIGSLSIVNSLDVLRQRVLLEMARRKALQDQKQIDANRRFLESIGKRSLPEYTGNLSKNIDTRTRNGLDYTIQQQEKNRDRTVTPERILGRIEDWFQADDPAFREEQTRRIGKSSTEPDSISVRWLPWHSTF